jgi:diaminohydroxyphosphoribosylaminopyrimidine deaminase/5-amino-6-(5-phosphoribosylamino)uracil reductase
MQQALDLASRGAGLTRPNPPVGAVLVRNGKVVGTGWHKQAGGPHAEVMAVASAKGPLKGASMYVTLEPCSTAGRTPPCCDLILKHRIKNVIISALDPNPLHAGGGVALLREAGVNVKTGVLQEQGERLLEPFSSWMLRGGPWVTLKLGVSLDGRIADRAGRSQWITGPEARKRVQELRRTADAVMVGAGTVKQDDPRLLPRPSKGRKPFRVIVDGALSSPLTSTCFTDRAHQRTLVLALKTAPAGRIQRLKKQGVQVRVYPGKKVPLKRALNDLAKEFGILHVLCEGGGELASGLIQAGLVDRYQWFTAPLILGGQTAAASVGGKGFPLDGATRLEFESMERLGADVLISAIPKKA